MLVGKDSLRNVFSISQPGTREPEHLGSQQMREFLRGKKQHLFNEATILVGVDAFYWDAEWQTCGTIYDPIDEIVAVTHIARARGKTIVLGTVPVEDPRLVRIDVRRVGYDFVWRPPNPACARQINAALHKHCVPENNCYLVDLANDVEVMKAGGKLGVMGRGSFGYYEMRPDGVHLSDVGVRYIAQSIVKALDAHPPVCRKTEGQWGDVLDSFKDF